MNELGLLYNHLPTELVPPSEVWNRIVEVLDDDERRTLGILNNLELEPPTLAWDNIATALDEAELKNVPLFADKFLTAEITPPSFVWGEIEKKLDADLPAVRKISGQPKIVRMVVIGLAVAACVTGVVFSVLNKPSDNQFVEKQSGQVAVIEKAIPNKQNTIPFKNIGGDSPIAKTTILDQNKSGNTENNLTLTQDDFALDSARELKLSKYSTVAVDDINTTNNKVASKTGKLKDANGNIIDKLSNYNTGGNYIAAIGPNGNTVNVSTKLANMIEFFQEDSVVNQHEEYLDKVMRESNVWRLKLIDWRKKVDAADAKPSKMNFLDLIDLIRFLKENEK